MNQVSALAEAPIAAEVRRPSPLTSGTLLALALGTFAVGTEGFMIAAILPTVARSLSVSIMAAGQLVTVFALVYAVSSPVLTTLTARVNRRTLLLGSLSAFAAANLVAAVAPGFLALLLARVLLAFAAGLYVPNANAVAGALAPPERRGRALAIINGGITIAIATGVPPGALVGIHFGWRATFAGVALLSLLAVSVLWFRLPHSIEIVSPASLRARLDAVRRPGALPVLLATLLWATGAYTVYTYVSPLLGAAAGLSPGGVGAVLVLLGVSAFGGIMAGGAATDRLGAQRTLAVSLPVLAATFAALTVATLAFAPHALVLMLPLVIVWGLSAWSFISPQQDRLIRLAGLSHAPLIISLNASFMYLGFSLGAALGALVISAAWVAWVGAAGSAMCLLAACVSRAAWRVQRRAA